MKENLFKKFRYILIAMITAGILLTACGSREEEAEQKSQSEELKYSPSTVENVDIADITGDGKCEVLIYRYFANTATEYTLINFFQIEENCVTEISPELELEELANNVWNVIDIDFSEEEYDMPVFTMESYGKMNALAYPDKRVLVGYQGGGWQILGWLE